MGAIDVLDLVHERDSEYKIRLLRAIGELEILRRDQWVKWADREDHVRLGGKIEGVRLALSYWDEVKGRPSV